jgi:undecaprenyl-diphosphatase
MDSFGLSLVEASLGLILISLTLTQLGLPVPETPLIIAAGVVCQRMGLSLAWPILTCCVAVVLGDLALYYLAHTLGPAAFRRRPLRWLLPPAMQPKVDGFFAKHGALTLFVARFVSGVRVCVFVLAGLRRVPVWRFLLGDGLAILVTVPVFAWTGYAFANGIEELDGHVAVVNRSLLLICAVVGLGYLAAVTLVGRRRARHLR